MNVLEIYLNMFDSRGKAIEHLCKATNRAFNKRYLTDWCHYKSRLPQECLAYVQDYVLETIVADLELDISNEKARLFLQAISEPPLKKKI
ncbi:hypothetical protein [Vibrio owensii]|uniref:hypothetical protein n=1 Tax=Vibrio owensii TaxID=696485 RepID=UPI00406876E6